jgi:glyceraldehyde 3-phosphate dehydrogenase
MAIKVGINGFGRIGRMVARIISQTKGIELVHINDLTPPQTLAHLFANDSVHGSFQGKVSSTDNSITIDKRKISVSKERNIEDLPWKDKKVDIVIEATGVFRKSSDITKHIESGAKKVLLTVPAKDELDATIVIGVNDKSLKKGDKLVSNASCTTNCLTPMMQVLIKEFGVKKSIMTTVHSYTADQNLVDAPHSDLRRSRAAALNIIPTTTGAAIATGKVLPELNKKIDGMALRVPTPSGSLTDLTAVLKKKVTKEEVNEAFKKASKTYLKGVLEYSTDPLVSSDIVGNPHSCIIDSLSTMVVDKDLVKIIGWYDNEWGYSNRVVDLIKKLK